MAFGIITDELQRGFHWQLLWSACACKGNGWASHRWDTWVQCPYHGIGHPHPEEPEYDGGPSPEAVAAVDRAVFRAIAEDFCMTNAQFRALVEKMTGPVQWQIASRRRRAIEACIEELEVWL